MLNACRRLDPGSTVHSSQRTAQRMQKTCSKFVIKAVRALEIFKQDAYRSRPEISHSQIQTVIMPRRNQDDGEDFEAEINAIESDESDDSDRSDEQSGSDLDQVRSVLAVPGADAEMHEVRKALAMAQQAYNATRSELRVLKRQYLALSSAIPARSRNRVLKKTSPLDSNITHQGQKYALFCQFWVANNLFPTIPQPNVDPRGATRWSSPDAKLKGAMAELYLFIPKDLHQSMETYTRFGSLFRAAVSSERSNILHSIKDCAGVIFAPFKLDPSLFADQPSKKQDNKDLLALSKRNGEGDYIRLAPVLFAKPNAMAADDFLKSPVLVKIVRVEMFGKAILGGKTRGHPKGRGLRMGAQSVSEGMIAGAAILARFLLTHDAELTAIGAETKIEYQKDYDFYLERLFKGTPWAISVMEYFNKEVFNASTALSDSTATAPSAPAPRTWEDDFLQELDNMDPVTCAPSPAHPIARTPSPALSTLSALSVAPPSSAVIIQDNHSVSTALNYTSTRMSISQTRVTAASTTQLQADMGQLSLAGKAGKVSEPLAPTGRNSKAPTRRSRNSAQPAAGTMAASESEAPAAAPKAKRVSTRSKKAANYK
ncbi:hypothetical protein BD769DRAFT_1676277 [Suillus cothurnatus]|nr:hypothetical protein BD769DRAFT_1676277 [Suillus cothurnatus]